MIIEVNGQQVEVDDSFATLSPEKQQETLQYITNAISPQSSVEVRGATEADLVNPLYGVAGGAFAGQIAGPAINKATEAFQKNRAARVGASAPVAAGKVPTSGLVPTPDQHTRIIQGGIDETGTTGRARQQGYNERTAAQSLERQAAEKNMQDLARRRIITGESPLTKIAAPTSTPSGIIVPGSAVYEAPTPAPAAKPPSMVSKIGASLPQPIQKLGSAIGGVGQDLAAGIGGAAQAGVTPYIGRALAGAGLGFQGTDVYNRLQQGDIPGAAISGLGAAGSLAAFVPTPITRVGGTAVGVGAELLNQYLDSLKKKVEAMGQPAAAPAPVQGPLSQTAPQGMAEGGGVKLPGKLGKIKNIGEAITSAAFRASPEQTVTNPLRNAFPGIYQRPDVIAKEAAARVAPEDPMLKRLFGVTRDDLFEMSKRQGNEPGFIPGASKNPKGSAAAEAVMNPRNTQRLVDVLGEVKTNAPELYRGMHAWYTMDPQYHRMVELMGEENAKKMYHRLNTFGGIESPNLPVPVEFNRASAANWLAEQGRMPDWIKYGGLRDKHLVEGIPSDIIGVPGRVGHQRASESQRKFIDTGFHGMDSPKAPPYIQASSVPELGFQTDLPVGDAHWSRMIGLPDVRTSKEVSASVSTPELQQLAPWWKKDVAGAMDLESVPAQAIMWGAGSPQTGVKTAIGAGKLELQAIQMAEAAKRLGISPEDARDMILMGKQRAGKKEGGLV